MTVLFVSAVAIAIAVALLQRGAISAQNVRVQEQGLQAWVAAESCGERGLEILRDDPEYTGGLELSVAAGSCRIEQVSVTGTDFRIRVTGTVDQIQRRLEVTGTVGSGIDVQTWREVAQFE